MTESETPAPIFELAWRELLFQHTEGLASALQRGTVTGYCGFDPTASSLHVGNLIPVMGLMHLQRAGHRPIALVGGGTGMIGDPSGRSSERTLQTLETIAGNADSIRGQLARFLDFDGPRGAKLVNNAEWLTSLSLLDFLRDTGKHFSVNYMLAKDSVKSRLEDGISFTEFSYMLLQAHDFLELHRREGVTLQVGGSDQWGNITAGLELIRKTTGAEAHALTFPLITNANGSKFGKSEAGAVWLDAARTSPYQFFQFWMGADDRDVSRFLRFFTLLERAEIEALDQAVRSAPEKREAQRTLATDVTTRVHGADAARVAREVSALLFEKADASTLSAGALDALRAEIPFAVYAPSAESGAATDGVDVYECLTALGFAASRGAAKRLLEQGGVSVNGVKLSATERTVSRDRLLGGRCLLLRKGARDYGLVDVPAE
ncbi:MAG: tyrosine--tRNA ligase [Gemmatimonadaceae bacterium]|nr:tyrosine--tRNA ligase [Gemmatimonadaceae bacterium]